MKRLSGEQIKMMHYILIEETGGIHGIRDENLLDSAINSPFQTFGGTYVYGTLEMKAARLCYSIIKNHAFIDGNKRIGILAMLTFLELHGIVIDYSDDELIALGNSVAEGTVNSNTVLDWILERQ